jgi:branched-chain amino acid transport system permease protein
MFSQLLINGLITGAIYALVSSGFSLIYSVCKFVHFAHGVVVTLSGYFLYFLFSKLGFNFWFSVILSIVFASLLGFLIDKIIYKELRKRKASNTILLIASVALLIFFESLILILFGADVKTISYIKISKGLEIFNAIITPLQIIIIIVSIILLILLFLFMKKTKLGKAMRAVADNKDVAEVIGISAEKIYSWSFIIGSVNCWNCWNFGWFRTKFGANNGDKFND